MQLIIPAATIVSEELQKIGKLPAIIYPVNQKIVFDYLFEQYSESCSSIEVICYEKGEKIHRRLSSYPCDKLNIRDLPSLSDLGHTIHYGLENCKGEVIINFADTIVTDDIQNVEGDAFFCSEDEVSETWTFFETEDGVIKKVLDKTVESVKGQKLLFVGVFKITDAPCFRICLEHVFMSKDSSISTFYQALMLYSESHPMKEIKTDNWFDIGHIDKYFSSQLEVKARDFNHITIDKNRGILRKSSDDKDKFIGEILWYLKLPTDVEYVSPRIFSYSTSYENPFVSMEYYAYHTIHELFLYGELTKHQWIDIFKRIRFVCDDFQRYTVKDVGIRLALKDMYLTKTLHRFEKIRSDKRFESFFYNTMEINGVRYKSLDNIICKLEALIPEMLYDVDSFNIIHGDLCFANIMIDGNLTFIKLIDPRGKFGTYDIYGDKRYELAKLFHSVDGKYDFIIKDFFDVEFDTDKAKINYTIKDRQRDYDLYEIFITVFENEIAEDLKKIELIESLLFLSMIPLHGESIKHQMAMLATGVEILDRVMKLRKIKKW